MIEFSNWILSGIVSVNKEEIIVAIEFPETNSFDALKAEYEPIKQKLFGSCCC